MPEPVYRVVTLLCAVVQTVPIGTNLGLVEVLWLLVSGRLLVTRGALIPGLAETGLAEAAVRRAWAGPQPTPGRLRRVLARCPFPTEFPWPQRIRQKAAVTAHLPKGASGPHPAAAREAA